MTSPRKVAVLGPIPRDHVTTRRGEVFDKHGWELRIALPALLRRFPGLALADPATEADFRSFSVVYGVRSLPVVW